MEVPYVAVGGGIVGMVYGCCKLFHVFCKKLHLSLSTNGVNINIDIQEPVSEPVKEPVPNETQSPSYIISNIVPS